MKFEDFGKVVRAQAEFIMVRGPLRVQVDKDSLWDTYLGSFPAGTNPIYRERTGHDCQCCKHFIRAIGGVIAIVDGKVATIWDVEIGGHYQVVADALAELVRSTTIENIYLSPEASVGTHSNHQMVDGQVRTWNHFHVALPRDVVAQGDAIGPAMSVARSTYDVMRRSLEEITPDAIQTVLDLIAQNSLYRGEEHQHAVERFQSLKQEFDTLPDVCAKELFCWGGAKSVPQPVSRIRNTAIGTLLVDLAEGKDLEYAVKSFEGKVAPTNYKRPTALITKAMTQKAQEKIEEMGFTTALERRYATIDDITINNILFGDREARKAMNVFDEIAARIPEKMQNLEKVEAVGIDHFLEHVLPKAESIEVMFENRHAGNLVSLIAPVDPAAKNMFKWPNNFSWSYAGELTDSIKERVKRAGGRVDGDFRASLSWFNFDDLDLHLMQPSGEEVYFAHKVDCVTKCELDVDMNAGGGTTRNAVENITFPSRRTMREGRYSLFVHQYHQREMKDGGFEVELEFDGVVHRFAYAKLVRQGENVIVVDFNYTHKGGIEIVTALPSSQASKTVWNVPTQTFHKVNVVMLSPNHWDNRPVGNKHYFFMLDKCLNEGKARGFFNEFLTDELSEHRKVFEVVGAKMKTEESDRQLSGLGFSSTQRNHVLCRVKGSFSRTIKVTF